MINLLRALCLIGVLAITSCGNNNEVPTLKRNNKAQHYTNHQYLDIDNPIVAAAFPSDLKRIRYLQHTVANRKFHFWVLAHAHEQEKSNYAQGNPLKRILTIWEEKDGNFSAILDTDQAVECIDCSGPNGDAFIGIAPTSTGFELIFGMYDNQFWKEIKTFELKDNQWVLVRDQYFIFESSQDLLNNDTPSALYKEDLNAQDFGQITLENFNIYSPKRR